MTNTLLLRIPRGPLCLLAGAALALAFAPYHAAFLSLLAPAVLAGAWLDASPRAAFIRGYLFGLGLFGAGVYWVYISINLFGGVNFLVAGLLTVLFVAFLALYPALAGWLSRRLFRQSAPALYLLAVIPGLWVLTEWLRGWLFTGFPWLNLGYSQIDTLLAGLAPLAGVYAVSLAAVLTACAITALAILPARGRAAAVLAVIAVWTGAWWAGRQTWTADKGRDISVAVVQGAVPQSIKWQPEMLLRSEALYRDLTMPYLDADLVVWPETAIPALYRQVQGYIDAMAEQARRHGAALVMGIPVQDPRSGRFYNALLALNGQREFYYKKHLVPFGEYIPFADTLGGLLEFLKIPMSDFSPGPDVRPLLHVSGMILGVSICYEDTFGEEVSEALPDAGVLVNVSNDAWFGDSAAPHQHLQMARMRALETGRYLLRATNTGVSALVDAHGNLVKASREFQPQVLTGRIPLRRGLTPYARWGNYPVITLALLMLIGAFVVQRGKKQ